MAGATDFLSEFQSSSQNAWEAGAVRYAANGDRVDWPFVEVPLSIPTSGPAAGHTASVFVASDVFAIGSSDDYLRMPLAPGPAQQIADAFGWLLPTRKLANDIFAASQIRLTPIPQLNKGPNLGQYADYDQKVQAQLGQVGGIQGQLISGHKKDVVLSNEMKPGHVVIYGWFKPDGSHIQPLTNIHDDHYADYSHGIRYVSPFMKLDGEVRNLEEIYQDPVLSALVSDEGPLHSVRYPTPGGASPATPGTPGGGGSSADTGRRNLYMLGLSTILEWAQGRITKMSKLGTVTS